MFTEAAAQLLLAVFVSPACFNPAQEAIDRKVLEEPNQMAIATADADGVPSVAHGPAEGL